MTNTSLSDLTQKLIDRAYNATHDEDVSAEVKNLKLLAETQTLLNTPIPEPEVHEGFFARHAGDLIKAGTTLTVVATIAAIEAKGDVIFRSKATKFL